MMAPAPTLTVEMADYGEARDAGEVVRLLDAYACDPMGGGEALNDDVRAKLVSGLAATPGAFSVIARLDGEAVGLANCMTTFSTFAARPIVNIHDMVVLDGHRGHGIGRAMFGAIETEAKSRDACKVTLEVLSGNEPAKGLYASLGYGDYQLDPAAGSALFWQKAL
ncbi:GNAT family N-acetyltransferase [Altererythrobacter sp. ZODW24]|uniref:GNAT family N-acetyltransferase n=1 Tax=Altererythrobacter sp. ZODW24 TaxID=2185142 RepID=UPI001F082428|nr:GNAT family N-acetyltransferase [Altererythrobacter sp. ZODW24]